jgi:von Willebrand factor type A domain
MSPVSRAAAVVVGGLVSTALVIPGVASPAGAAAPCAPVTNIEAIIDDSGSMAGTDPNRLRVQAMDLLINALDGSTTLGAVEFGTIADNVFPAEAVGPNAAAMKAALDSGIQADSGGTDYNAAFDSGRAANPGAAARIFLTDGGHNAGTYLNTHLNPAPQAQTPTYVIGFSTGLSLPEDQARLAQIASDTGGAYYPLPDASALQSVMNQIETGLTCQSAPKTFTDSLKPGKSKQHTVTIAKRSNSAQLALTWTSPLDTFKIKGLKIVQHGDVVAARRVGHLKVKIIKGTTYMVVKVSRLVAGKLHFKVKAAKIGSGAPEVTLTTQVSQSKSRH